MSDASLRHPEVQTMAAFLDGTLAPDEIPAVADHLRECPDCRLVVTETARFVREEEQLDVAKASPRWRWRWWMGAAAAAVLAVMAIPRILRQTSPIEQLIATAPREHRVVEARLSGFPWARVQAPSRGGAPPDPADLKLAGAAGDVLEKTRDQHAAEALHARGVAYLLIDRHSESITALEEAAGHGGDQRIWSDLAAARYAAAEEHPSQLPQALAAADRALQLDPNFPDAHFNRALILERMGLRDRARSQWQRYLEIDPGSGWSIEAKDHLRRLQAKGVSFDRKFFDSLPADTLVRRFPQEARTWGEAPLLAGWAAAEVRHDALDAEKKLGRVRLLAASLGTFRGEHLLADAVAAIDRATPGTRATLAAAQLAYDDARRTYNRTDAGQAERQFLRAAEDFRRAGSPMADVAGYYAACAAFDQHRGTEARDTLTGLLATVDGKRHRALAAQIQWQLAVVANADGDYGSGLRFAESSAGVFRELGESFNAAFVDCIAAHSFDVIGASDLAWTYRARSFPILSANRAMFNATLHSAAETIGTLGRIDEARALLDVLLDDETGAPAQLAAAYASRARFDVRDGNAAAGRRSVASARAATNSVKNAALREMLNAQADLADAAMRITVDPRAAIALLDRNIALFAAGGAGKLLPDAYLQRARAFRAAGDDAAAAADYTSALRQIEQQRKTITDAELRLRFLDVALQIVEGSIELYLSEGRAAEAFAVADRTRALFDNVSAGSERFVPPRVESGQTIIEYAVLPRSIAIFCLTADGIRATKVAFDRRELAGRVESFAQKIRSRAPAADIHQEGAALYALLIAPILPQLTSRQDIVVILDRELHGVPFAALYDRENDRYLAEEMTVRLASSATAAQTDGDSALRPALVVADPAAPHWPRLPASGDEAEKIAAAYGTTTLRGEAATRARFIEAAQESALIHFAGHADSDVRASYAALQFAASPSDSGVLGAGEIARLVLSHRPLVVLAACGTFRGSQVHVAGMPSLARAFLLAGARGVIGTLWEIDDDVSAPLFLRIHDHLRAGASPARAVRAAQIEMIHASDARLRHPATWAPVTLLSSSL